MVETRVELGYLLKSYYSHTQLSLLRPYCMDRVSVCKTFVVDLKCTRMGIYQLHLILTALLPVA